MTAAEAAELLGVPEDAPLTDVQHAFLRLARLVHPDTRPDASEPELADAAARFDALSQAREVLFESRPVIPIELLAAVPTGERRPGIGGSLAVLAVLVFLLIAIVTMNDAFRASTVGTLDPVQGSTPAATP
jgi:hypothetical protein